jgi:hypothetical protein
MDCIHRPYGNEATLGCDRGHRHSGRLGTYNMSGRQPQQHPEADRTIQPPIPFAPRSPPPLPGTLVTTRSAQKVPIAKHPPTRSREEQARQQRLEVERALLSVDDARRFRAYRQLLPALIKLDPAAVEQLIASWPDGPAREELLRNTAHAWSNVSVDEAVDWASGATNSLHALRQCRRKPRPRMLPARP